jgi:hypothetical protein
MKSIVLSDLYAPRGKLYNIISSATKIFCSAAETIHGDSNRWSPELPQYLFTYPEKCAETLQIVASDHYRDPYYDDDGFYQKMFR